MSKGEKVFFFILFLLWIGMIFGLNAMEDKASEPDCYRREYVGERQELEQYKIFEIECEEIGK